MEKQSYHLLILDENYLAKNHEYFFEWKKIYSNTRKKCIAEFHRYLIDLFSNFDEDESGEYVWGNVERKDIEIRDISDKKYDYSLKFYTDGEKIQVNCIEKSSKIKVLQDKLIYQLSYGTNGGLCLDIYALLIPESTEMIFKRFKTEILQPSEIIHEMRLFHDEEDNYPMIQEPNDSKEESNSNQIETKKKLRKKKPEKITPDIFHYCWGFKSEKKEIKKLFEKFGTLTVFEFEWIEDIEDNLITFRYENKKDADKLIKELKNDDINNITFGSNSIIEKVNDRI